MHNHYTFGAVLAVIVLAAYALITRFLALSQPYHHDEYKWALAADPSYGMTDTIPHPFLIRFLYQEFGAAFGYDALRLMPAFFSLVLVVVLFLFVRRWFGKVEAYAATALYVFTTFALIGSVQIDIDGVFLPLLALASFWAYLSMLEKPTRIKFFLLAVFLVLGFLAKLSFILVPATIIAHVVLTRLHIAKKVVGDRKVLMGILGGAALILLLVFLAWEHVQFFRYVENFLALSERNYAQVVFQSVKAALLLSPLLVLGILLSYKYRNELTLWYLFLAANTAFYYIVFDFTHRTFDRYLLFFILPLSLIVGVSLARRLHVNTAVLTFGAGVFLGTLLLMEYLAWLPHRVLPLIPKTAFVESVAALRFDILLPITGGSGPLGFYLPADALIAAWCIAVVAFLVAFVSQKARGYALMALMAVSLSYSLFVTREYLTGTHYGFAPRVVEELLSKSGNEPVLTYNDIGAYELHEKGVYAARFYPHTEFIPDNLEKLAAHEGVFLVVNIPALDPESVYGRFFSDCKPLASSKDGVIEGALLDCEGVETPLP